MRELSYHQAINPTGSEGHRDPLRQHEGPQPDVLDEAVDPHLQSCRAAGKLLAIMLYYYTIQLYYVESHHITSHHVML